MHIRPCELADAEKICGIYNYYIRNTVITFEETPLATATMASRITAYTKAYPWLVGEIDGEVVGYAYATQWKERAAYKNTAEVTIYLANGLARKGYGKALYAALLDELKKMNCHVALGCIAVPNNSSEQLHAFFGFKKVAHFSEVGRKFDLWLDVSYWQKILR